MKTETPPKCRVHVNVECTQKAFGYKVDVNGTQRQRYVWACPECNEYMGGVKD